MTTVREALATSAENVWSECIKDDDLEAVTALFVENGFGWHVQRDGTDGLYDKSPGLEYCGHTAAVAGRRIGDYADPGRCVPTSLDPALCRLVLPSTSRLATQRWWAKAGYQRSSALADDVVRGAVCTVRDNRHIIIAQESPQAGRFNTVEGNTNGRFPDGTEGKGVVRRTRRVEEVDFVYVFSEEHVTNEEPFR